MLKLEIEHEHALRRGNCACFLLEEPVRIVILSLNPVEKKTKKWKGLLD